MFAAAFRRLPDGAAKRWCYERLYLPYFEWRPLQVTTRTTFGARMLLRLPDSIQTPLFLTGRWEPVLTDLIVNALSPGDVFIDVGANAGYYTLLAATAVRDAGRVYAFEASPGLYQLLSENVAANHFSNVQLSCVAVGDAPGACTIFAPRSSNAGHGTIVPAVAEREGHRAEAVVRCDVLSALMPLHDLLRARVVKIDIEGAERMAVEGIVAHLPQFSVETEWLIELSPEFCPGGQADVERIFSVFIAAGYRAFLVKNDYSIEFLYGEQSDSSLVCLHAAPSDRLNDVLFSRRRRDPTGTRRDPDALER
jgi:FkbM family methyltransferase